MHHWQNATWNLKILIKQRNIWTNTIVWLKSLKLKITLPTAHITWQNFSKKRIRMKKPFNTFRHIFRQLNLRNKIKKIENLLIRQELHLPSQRQIKTWISTLRCLLMMINKVWEKSWIGRLKESWSDFFEVNKVINIFFIFLYFFNFHGIRIFIYSIYKFLCILYFVRNFINAYNFT